MLLDTNTVDNALITVGSLYSLANIETLLGIIILIIQLVWVVIKVIFFGVKFVKKRLTPDEFIENVDEALHTLDEEVDDGKSNKQE